MASQSYSLVGVERAAAGKPIVAVVIHYRGRCEPVTYPWSNRRQIVWDRVERCRLDFDRPTAYRVGDEHCNRPGFRVAKS